eukprot:403340748
MNHRNFMVLVISCLSFVCQGEESFYKIRLYKSLLQDLFQNNLKIIFDQASKLSVEDAYLSDIQSSMKDISIKLTPSNPDLKQNEVEVFFDEGQIMLEMHNLQINGHGMLKEPEFGFLEQISFQAPVQTGQIIITPTETVRNSNMYPKFLIDEVNIILDESNIIVSAQGQVPLFKTKKFEAAIQKWLHQENRKLIQSIKDRLIEIDRNLWQKIPYEYKGLGYKFVYDLSENVKLTDEFIEMSFENELEGADHSEFGTQLRKIYPQFSDLPEWKQDLQMVFDENFINHLLLSLYHNNKVFSLRDLVLKVVPKKYQNALLLISNLFMTTTLYPIFPDLVKDFNHGKLVDIRCGFSRQFLSDKFDTNELTASQVWFRDDNKMEFSMAFGCGIFAYTGKYNPFSPTPLEEKYWKNWRSFFFQGQGLMKMEFFEHNLLKEMRVKFIDGNLDIKQMKIFKGEVEQSDEEGYYTDKIQDMFSGLLGSESSGFSFMKHPTVLTCLGVRPTNPLVEIKEGFIRASYNMKVSPADEECLFNKQTRLH